MNNELYITFNNRLGKGVLSNRSAFDQIAERPNGAENVQGQFRRN